MIAALLISHVLAQLLHPINIEIDRIQRSGGGDKQAVELGATEADVADYFGYFDFADQLALSIEAMHAVGSRRPDAPSAIEAEAIEKALRAGGKDFTA